MLDNVKEELNKFGKYVIQQSRTNLTKNKINATGDLYGSLGYDLKVMPNSVFMEFYMMDYGKFVDEGVKGSKSTYPESRNSPFKFTGRYKMIPPKSLDKWVIKKGIKGIRDDKGRFITRQSLKYAIATSLYQKGTKATLFFTKPFEKAFMNLPDEVIQAFALDIDEFLQYTTE